MTRQLLADETLTQDDLDRLFVAADSPEQRHRLLRIARHHLIRRWIKETYGQQPGDGSMGLTHHVVQTTGPDGATQRTGVLVVLTLPGFPAYETLDPGDIIIDFNDEPVPDSLSARQFQELIKTQQANSQINMTVMRQGEATELVFTFGYSQALIEVYDTGEVKLNEPCRSQWTALRKRMLALIGEGEDEDAAGVEPTPE